MRIDFGFFAFHFSIGFQDLTESFFKFFKLKCFKKTKERKSMLGKFFW